MTQEQLEHACIALKVPKSGNAELDALILESRRMDLAGQALTAMVTRSARDPDNQLAAYATGYADALLRALWPQDGGGV